MVILLVPASVLLMLLAALAWWWTCRSISPEGSLDEPAGPAIDPRRLYLVIPVQDRILETRQCLTSLRCQTARGFRVVLIDDGSSDGTCEMVRAEFPDTILLSGDGSLGWFGAANFGIDAALARGATHILTLTSDTVAPPAFVDRMLAAAAELPDALIGASIVDGETGKPCFGGECMNWLTGASRSLLQDPHPGDFVPVTHCPGRGLLISACVFASVGRFDARRFVEAAADYDFTNHARRAGYRLVCDYSSALRICPQASGEPSRRQNYASRPFLMEDGGTLRAFFWYAIRNCPLPLLPVCLTIGTLRRAGGHLIEWARESLDPERRKHACREA